MTVRTQNWSIKAVIGMNHILMCLSNAKGTVHAMCTSLATTWHFKDAPLDIHGGWKVFEKREREREFSLITETLKTTEKKPSHSTQFSDVHRIYRGKLPKKADKISLPAISMPLKPNGIVTHDDNDDDDDDDDEDDDDNENDDCIYNWFHMLLISAWKHIPEKIYNETGSFMISDIFNHDLTSCTAVTVSEIPGIPFYHIYDQENVICEMPCSSYSKLPSTCL